MHSHTKYIPVRVAGDCLDVVSVLHAGLTVDRQRYLMSFDDDLWTVERMAARVAWLQQILRDKNIGAGDRVAVMLRNSPVHIALIYALMLSGIIWIPVNIKLKSLGLEYVLHHSSPKLMIVEPEFLAEIERSFTAGPSINIISSDELQEEQTPATALARFDVAPDHVLCIIYTSGTTGAPKGVLFTHRMMRLASEAARMVAQVRDGDCLFLWEPLCHIGGAQMLLIPFLAQARLAVVATFSASQFWKQIQRGECTQLHYLGGILDILMCMPRKAQPPAHLLRLAWGAGVNASAWAETRERLQIDLRECYGMTEGASFATVNQNNKPGSIGKALPWLTVELLDDNDTPVPIGESGQIVVSSEIAGNFLPGYLDNPRATAQTLRKGKLYTGDMARADADGDFYFIGRRTESMRVRGENVSAWEVERVFLEYGDVAAVAAVGVKSEIGEQEILLYVQWQKGAEKSFVQLSAWAQSRLAAFQWPRYYLSIERFALTPSERIRKHLLARDIETAWDRQHA